MMLQGKEKYLKEKIQFGIQQKKKSRLNFNSFYIYFDDIKIKALSFLWSLVDDIYYVDTI